MSKPWGVYDEDNGVHCCPMGDDPDHFLDSKCWCAPEVVWKDPETGAILNKPMVLHRAADGRGHIEEAERLIREASKV